MDSHQKSLPDVFDFLDAQFYLQEYYRARKALDRKFSYEVWSQELEIKSRSFLRMVVMGKKKITPNVVEAFSRQNFSSKEEQEYFYCLVQASQAGNAKAKQIFSSKMIELLKKRTQKQVINDYADFVSSPLLPRLHTLLSFQDVDRNETHLAQLLNIKLEEIKPALEKLREIGLADVQDGQWMTKTDSFHIPDQYGSFDLMKFHEKSLLDAIQAFHQPKELRRYKSLLLPMSEAGLQEFHRLLDDFASEQIIRFQSSTFDGKRMFQANFNIYSVTESIDSAAKTQPA